MNKKIKTQTGKRIVRIILCKKCEKEFQAKATEINFELGNHQQCCSLSCSNSFRMMGNKNPMFGKIGWNKGKTKETDNRVKLISEKMTGENHHFFGKSLSDEHKLNISKGLDTDFFREQSKKPCKQKYQEKYGENWEEHYNNFLDNMKKTNTVEWFVNKFGQEEGIKKYNERCSNLKMNSYFVTHPEELNNNAFSKISQELFWCLYLQIKSLYDKIYFAELNHEHSCKTGAYRFDFVILDNKKIIEFNGDKFHPKYNLTENELKNWTTPHGVLGTLITERDKMKKEKAEINGYEILYIWEGEYKNNKEKEINKCLEFIKS